MGTYHRYICLIMGLGEGKHIHVVIVNGIEIYWGSIKIDEQKLPATSNNLCNK